MVYRVVVVVVVVGVVVVVVVGYFYNINAQTNTIHSIHKTYNKSHIKCDVLLRYSNLLSSKCSQLSVWFQQVSSGKALE